MRSLLFATVIFATFSWADDASLRAKLMGHWQPAVQGAKDAWTLESKGGDVLHVTHSLGDEKLTEFDCSTRGSECRIEDSGKPAKISMWFNGTQLVELENASVLFCSNFADLGLIRYSRNDSASLRRSNRLLSRNTSMKSTVLIDFGPGFDLKRADSRRGNRDLELGRLLRFRQTRVRVLHENAHVRRSASAGMPRSDRGAGFGPHVSAEDLQPDAGRL